MSVRSHYLTTYADFQSKVEGGQITVRYYRCPVKSCRLHYRNKLTLVQLLQHLRNFHQKPTLARALCRLAAKLQDQTEDLHKSTKNDSEREFCNRFKQKGDKE